MGRLAPDILRSSPLFCKATCHPILYLGVLEETCEAIIPRHRRLARAIPERPGILRWRVERHVVFFREVEDGIEIVCMLHEQMLPSRHP